MTDTPHNPEQTPTSVTPKSNEKSVAEMIADSLKPMVEGFATLRQDIEALKTAATPAPPQRTPTEMPSVFDGEDAAFNARMTPLLQTQLEMDAKMARNEIKQEYIDAGFGDFWKTYEKDIIRQLDGTALVTPDGAGGVKKLRGDSEYIRNVVNMLIGRAATDKGMRFDGAKSTFFLEGANGSDATRDTKPDVVEGLTTKQVALAKRLGIPLDKMRSTVGKMEFVS